MANSNSTVGLDCDITLWPSLVFTCCKQQQTNYRVNNKSKGQLSYIFNVISIFCCNIYINISNLVSIYYGIIPQENGVRN